MNPETREPVSGSHTSQPDNQSRTDRAKDELKQDARSIKESVGKQADNQARKGRDEAVGSARATGSALDRAADELRRDDDTPDWLASMLSKAAGQIQQIASDFENREPREMMHSVEDFGRQRPGMFLAASAAAGFAAGRYLRAGAEQHGDIDAVEPGDPLGEADSDDPDRAGLAPAGSPSGSRIGARGNPQPSMTSPANRNGSDRAVSERGRF
ncbi:MAG: hypothetical protein V2I27_01660 [Erythrobacter sp.]|jgi:hypothetical protein|nr:hypothetical protein [Erythrobacter sp.]